MTAMRMEMKMIFTERVELATGIKEGESGVYADSVSMEIPPQQGDRLTISFSPENKIVELVCVSRHYRMVRGEPPLLSVLFDLAPS